MSNSKPVANLSEHIFFNNFQDSKLLDLVLAESADMICIFDQELRIIYLNKKAEEKLGVSLKDIKDEYVLDAFPALEATASFQDLHRALKGEVVQNTKKKSLAFQMDFDNKITPIFNEAHKVIGILSIARDVSEFVKVNNQLSAANEEIEKQNKALLYQNDFVNDIINASRDIIVVIDQQHRFLAFNKSAYENILPFNETAIGKSVEEVIPHASTTPGWKYFLESLTGKPSLIKEYKFATDERYWEVNFTPMLKNGKTEAVIIIYHEITELVNARKILELTNIRLTHLNTTYERAEIVGQFGSFRYNLQTHDILCSNNLYRLLGREPHSFEPGIKKFLEIIVPADHARVITAVENVVNNDVNTTLEFGIVKNDHEQAHLRGNISLYTDEQSSRWIIGTIHDITQELIQQKNIYQTTEQLHRIEESYHLMVDEVQDYAIILLDPEGNIQNWNKGAERIKGYSAQEAIGKHISIFYTPQEKEAGLPGQLLKTAKDTGKAIHEGWRVRKGGMLFWGNVVITRLLDKTGTIIGYSKVTRDLTERKIADDNTRRHAQVLEEKNADLETLNKELQSFAYVASHDLQEPLRKIQFFSNLIVQKEEDNLSVSGKDYFRRMQEASKRMQALIEDLLSFSRTNSAEKVFEKAKIKQLVEEVLYEMKEITKEKNATINIVSVVDIPVIKFQFRQLMQNLVSNSLKFSKKDEPPVIDILAESITATKDHPMLNENEAYCRIQVMDNGVGFEPEYKTKIFEIFQRLHGKHEYKGTGIGLAICKKIVENHNGYIMAESEPGEGSVFTIYLPCNQPTASETPETA